MKSGIKAGTFKIEENWTFTLVDSFTKEIIEKTEICNTVVNDGLIYLRNWMAGDSVSVPIALAIGTGSTAVQNTDSSLGVETERETATVTKPSDYKVKYEKTFTFGSGVSYTVYEAGLFNSTVVSGSTMIARVVEAGGKAISNAVDLIVTAEITIARP